MEIILKKDVQNLGFKDDVVNVKNGYGRNFLIPQGFGLLATPSAKKVLAENLKQRAHKEAKVVADAKALAETLKGINLTVRIKVQKLTVYTWDNFKAVIPIADLSKYGVILATSLNGKRLQMDDWGPMFIVYPYDDYKELRRPAGLSKMAWQVCRIDIS